jgi:hypothetical protein
MAHTGLFTEKTDEIIGIIASSLNAILLTVIASLVAFFTNFFPCCSKNKNEIEDQATNQTTILMSNLSNQTKEKDFELKKLTDELIKKNELLDSNKTISENEKRELIHLSNEQCELYKNDLIEMKKKEKENKEEIKSLKLNTDILNKNIEKEIQEIENLNNKFGYELSKQKEENKEILNSKNIILLNFQNDIKTLQNDNQRMELVYTEQASRLKQDNLNERKIFEEEKNELQNQLFRLEAKLNAETESNNFLSNTITKMSTTQSLSTTTNLNDYCKCTTGCKGNYNCKCFIAKRACTEKCHSKNCQNPYNEKIVSGK